MLFYFIDFLISPMIYMECNQWMRKGICNIIIKMSIWIVQLVEFEYRSPGAVCNFSQHLNGNWSAKWAGRGRWSDIGIYRSCNFLFLLIKIFIYILIMPIHFDWGKFECVYNKLIMGILQVRRLFSGWLTISHGWPLWKRDLHRLTNHVNPLNSKCLYI